MVIAAKGFKDRPYFWSQRGFIGGRNFKGQNHDKTGTGRFQYVFKPFLGRGNVFTTGETPIFGPKSHEISYF